MFGCIAPAKREFVALAGRYGHQPLIRSAGMLSQNHRKEIFPKWPRL
jgi:hypothetical protein